MLCWCLMMCNWQSDCVNCDLVERVLKVFVLYCGSQGVWAESNGTAAVWRFLTLSKPEQRSPSSTALIVKVRNYMKSGDQTARPQQHEDRPMKITAGAVALLFVQIKNWFTCSHLYVLLNVSVTFSDSSTVLWPSWRPSPKFLLVSESSTLKLVQ